ncbi:MAG: hypothetical protein IJY06_02160, partial [Oscillospiraceae bacterium]|nr:hypothetical protein [Oscillospiraceae bacterium]
MIAKKFEGTTELGYRPYTGPYSLLGTDSGYTIPLDKLTGNAQLADAVMELVEVTPDGEKTISTVKTADGTEFMPLPSLLDYSGDGENTVGTAVEKEYVLREISAPEGYVLDRTQVYTVKLSETVDAQETFGEAVLPTKVTVNITVTGEGGFSYTSSFTVEDTYTEIAVPENSDATDASDATENSDATNASDATENSDATNASDATENSDATDASDANTPAAQAEADGYEQTQRVITPLPVTGLPPHLQSNTAFTMGYTDGDVTSLTAGNQVVAIDDFGQSQVFTVGTGPNAKNYYYDADSMMVTLVPANVPTFSNEAGFIFEKTDNAETPVRIKGADIVMYNDTVEQTWHEEDGSNTYEYTVGDKASGFDWTTSDSAITVDIDDVSYDGTENLTDVGVRHTYVNVYRIHEKAAPIGYKTADDIIVVKFGDVIYYKSVAVGEAPDSFPVAAQYHAAQYPWEQSGYQLEANSDDENTTNGWSKFNLTDETSGRVISMQDEKIQGAEILVQKINEQTGALVAGATLSLYAEDDTLIQTFTSGTTASALTATVEEDGKVYAANGYLMPGNYYLTEDDPPEGYVGVGSETKMYFHVKDDFSVVEGLPKYVSTNNIAASTSGSKDLETFYGAEYANQNISKIEVIVSQANNAGMQFKPVGDNAVGGNYNLTVGTNTFEPTDLSFGENGRMKITYWNVTIDEIRYYSGAGSVVTYNVGYELNYADGTTSGPLSFTAGEDQWSAFQKDSFDAQGINTANVVSVTFTLDEGVTADHFEVVADQWDDSNKIVSTDVANSVTLTLPNVSTAIMQIGVNGVTGGEQDTEEEDTPAEDDTPLEILLDETDETDAVTLSVPNSPKEVEEEKLSISKTDMVTSKLLVGAKLTLKRIAELDAQTDGYVMLETPVTDDGDEDTAVNTWDWTTEQLYQTDELGNFVLDDQGEKIPVVDAEGNPVGKVHEIAMPADGIYELTEVAAPMGYQTAETVYFEIKDGKVTNNLVKIVTTENSDGSVTTSVVVEETETEAGNAVVMEDAPFVEISKVEIVDGASTEIAGAQITFNKLVVDVTYAEEDTEQTNPIYSVVYAQESEEDEAELLSEPIDSWTSEANKTHVIDQTLKDGFYQLHEVAAPDGYQVTTDIFVKIEDGLVTGRYEIDKNDVLTLVNEKMTQKLNLTDEKSIINISKKAVGGEDELPGAVLTLTLTEATKSEMDAEDFTGLTNVLVGGVAPSTRDKTVIIWTSTNNPAVLTGLPDGKYTLEETGDTFEAEDGTVYEVLTSTFEFTIKDGVITEPGKVVEDETNGSYEATSDNVIVVSDAAREAADVVISKKKLLGEEYVNIPDAVLTITAMKEVAGEDGSVSYVTDEDADITTGISATRAADSTVYILDMDENVKYRFSYTSSDSDIVLKGLTPGVYQMVENTAPAGYAKVSVFYFVVDATGKADILDAGDNDGTVTAENGVLTLIDKVLTATISKKDITSDEEIEGATLKVRAKDGQNLNGVTSENNTLTYYDAEGKEVTEITDDTVIAAISFVSKAEDTKLSMLPIGEYELTETQAPDGYAISEETVVFEIDAYGKVTGMTEMSDDREVFIAKMDIAKANYIAGAKLKLTAENPLTAEQIKLIEAGYYEEETNEETGTTTKTWKPVTEGVTINTTDISWVSNGKYDLVIRNLPDGNYTLEESGDSIVGEDGEIYNVLTSTYSFTITGNQIGTVTPDSEETSGGKVETDGVHRIVVSDAQKEKSYLTISKQDIVDSKDVIGAELILEQVATETTAAEGDGITYNVTSKVTEWTALAKYTEVTTVNEAGETVTTTVVATDENGNPEAVQRNISMPDDGIYRLTEVTAPDGYQKAEEIFFEIENGKVTKYYEEVIDENGKATLKEIKFDEEDSPIAADHVIMFDSPSVTISKVDMDGNEIGGAEITFNRIEVVESTDADNNVTVTVQTETNEEEVNIKVAEAIDSWTSVEGETHTIIRNKDAEDGTYNQQLEDGYYQLHEVAAPDGYQVTTDIFVKIENGRVVGNYQLNKDWTLTKLNEEALQHLELEDKKSEIEISKVGMTDGAPELEGAVLTIYDTEDNVVELDGTPLQHTSAIGSTWTITGIPDGTYVLKETGDVVKDENGILYEVTNTSFQFVVENGVIVDSKKLGDDDEKAGFEVSRDDKNAKDVITISDAKKTVTISKIDFAGNEVVGAQLKITFINEKGEETVLDSWVSEAGKNHEITNLT